MFTLTEQVVFVPDIAFEPETVKSVTGRLCAGGSAVPEPSLAEP